MLDNRIESIAKAIGKLQGKDGIDEKTRCRVTYDIEDAIVWSSTPLTTELHNEIRKFRKLAKIPLGAYRESPYLIEGES